MRNDEAQSGGGLPLGGFWERVKGKLRSWRQFLHDTRVEMRQVTWPTWSDVQSTTVVVIITVVFFGIFFFFTDRILFWLYQWVTSHLKA